MARTKQTARKTDASGEPGAPVARAAAAGGAGAPSAESKRVKSQTHAKATALLAAAEANATGMVVTAQPGQKLTAKRSGAKATVRAQPQANAAAAAAAAAKAETATSKRRYRLGTVALRQIRYLQKNVNTLIPRASFQRLVREITANTPTLGGVAGRDMRYQLRALEALQEATEAYLVGLFQDSVACMLHAKRKTLVPADMGLSLRLRGQSHLAPSRGDTKPVPNVSE